MRLVWLRHPDDICVDDNFGQSSRRNPSFKALTIALLLGSVNLAPAFAQDLSPEDQAVNANTTLGETATAPTAWLGATPHFVMVGKFGDYSFNVNLPGLDGTDVAVTGKREYGRDDAGALHLKASIATSSSSLGPTSSTR